MSVMNSLPRRPANLEQMGSTSEKSEKNSALTKDFLELFSELELEGLFEPAPLHVVLRISELFLLFFLGSYLLIYSANNLTVRIFGVLLLALCEGRAGWVGHEAGHHSLTGIPKFDRLIISFIYGFFDGISGSYWTSQHSRHHAMPQHVKHDVDLQTLPLLAFNTKTVSNSKAGKTFLIQKQKSLFLGTGTIVVYLLWKCFLHPRYCLRKKNYMELAFMALYYVRIPLIGIFNHFVALWLASIYLFGNFSLSHSHLPVTEDPTHWVEYSLTHTANVRSSWWVDYWMGNLNYQIEHHLFPTMPQFRNKLCRDRVKALAKKHNLPYNLFSYDEAVRKMWDNLDTVSKELEML